MKKLASHIWSKKHFVNDVELWDVFDVTIEVDMKTPTLYVTMTIIHDSQHIGNSVTTLKEEFEKTSELFIWLKSVTSNADNLSTV